MRRKIFYRVQAYTELGFNATMRIVKSALIGKVVVALFSLPGVKHWVKAKVGPETSFVARVKMTRCITQMSLRDSRTWVRRHFGE